MEKRKERRRPATVKCPYCKHEMMCMNKFESIYQLVRGFYVWYVCPSRKGEDGCGHSILFEISPYTKQPQRIVSSVKFRKVGSKRNNKK